MRTGLAHGAGGAQASTAPLTLLRQSFQQRRPGNPRPENVSIRARTRMTSPSRPRSRQVTLAVMRKRSARNTAIARSPARTVGFGAVADSWASTLGFANAPARTRRSAPARFSVARLSHEQSCGDRPERQTVSRLAAFQAELGPRCGPSSQQADETRSLRPASAGRATGRSRSSTRGNLCSGSPRLREFRHHRLPHFLPRYRSWPRAGRVRRPLADERR